MKTLDNEFNKLYEKLSNLFEDGAEDDAVDIDVDLSNSPAPAKEAPASPVYHRFTPEPKPTPADKIAFSKAFWASLKTDYIDIESFHKAYDDDFESVTYDDMQKNPELKSFINYYLMFNSQDEDGGLLSHKSWYSEIKQMPQDMWCVKALKKLWTAQFVDNKTSKKGEETKKKRKAEAEAAEQKRKEQERIAKENEKKKIEDINKLFQSHLNMKVINRVLEISTDPEDILPHYGGNNFYYVHGRTGIKTDDYLRAAKHCNTYYEGRMNELEAELDYSRCSWYKPFMEWCKVRKSKNSLDYYRFIFQDKTGKIYVPISDNGLDHYTPDILSRLKALGAPIDVDLVSVTLWAESGGGYTYQSSYSYSYTSISNKASAEVINKIGLKGKPMSSFNTYSGFEFFGNDSGWKEMSKEEAMKYNHAFFIDGMDKWFRRVVEHYPTD